MNGKPAGVILGFVVSWLPYENRLPQRPALQVLRRGVSEEGAGGKE